MRRRLTNALNLLLICATAQGDDDAAAAAIRRQCDDWAAIGECEKNAAYMKASCGQACECARWARMGECERNAAYMNESCLAACTRLTLRPPPPPPTPDYSGAQCEQWARSGECTENESFMRLYCSDECVLAKRRTRCSERMCAGLPEAPCDGVQLQPTAASLPFSAANPAWRKNGSWPIRAFHEVNTPYDLALINDGGSAARLFWVDEANKETSFGVLMPGGRLVQQTFVGHHWRVRELLSEHDDPMAAPLLADLHAGVLTAHSCTCGSTSHRHKQQQPPPPKQSQQQPPGGNQTTHSTDAGVDLSNATSMLVELKDIVAARVTLWRWALKDEKLVGTVHPMGSRVPNATHQLLLRGVRPGDVISVSRLHSGQTIMQHVVGDVDARPCESARQKGGGKGEGKRGRREQDDDAEAVAAAVAEKARALDQRREAARSEIGVLSEALERLKEIDPSLIHSLDEETVLEYVETASKALLNKRSTTTTATASSSSSSSSGKKEASATSHDELR